MTEDQPNKATEPTLADRLARIKELEDEITRKAASIMKPGTSMGFAGMFVIGATKRTLAQSRGFRDLLTTKNLPCAKAILRLQIDTAMRVNGLLLVADREERCKEVLAGRHFNTLKDKAGNKLTDAHLRKKLAETHGWITQVYEQTSDFIHLSGRHLFTSTGRTDDKTQTANFIISGKDPPRPDNDYFEIVDTFFKATKMVGNLLLAFFCAQAAISAALATKEVDPQTDNSS